MARRPSSHSGSAREVVNNDYAIDDSSLRMIRISLSLCAHDLTAAAKNHYILPALLHASTSFLTAGRAVEPRGFEPLTSAVQRRRSPN